MARQIKLSNSRAGTVARRKRKPAVHEEADKDERILNEATVHLIFKYGMFLVATGLREASVHGFRVWIITVTLRHTTGFEGYIGELLYDGKEFTFITPPEVRAERARRIDADPEGIRRWHEYQASTLRAAKA